MSELTFPKLQKLLKLIFTQMGLTTNRVQITINPAGEFYYLSIHVGKSCELQDLFEYLNETYPESFTLNEERKTIQHIHF
jgi:hypothetical protein